MTHSTLKQRSDLALAVGVLLILAVMIVPVPTVLLDLFLVADLALAIMILALTIYVQRPLDFNAFPTVLLLATLFRLALNVATTRQILLHGYGGKVIAAFGDFVVGGNYAVGAVAFLILCVIQFMVITKGAQRIAEVTARFTLDAMPGRQMAIDADLNAGLIDEREARRRRADISQQADFYGAMDGAAKFVRGDAVAAILITLVNLIGGFVIGMVQLNMSLNDSLRTFTMLTIGDGLVAQIPALIISTASGILITRTEGQRHLGEELSGQMLGDARAPFAASGILFLLGIVPGLPLLPFWVLSALSLGAGLWSRRERLAVREAPAEGEESRPAGPETPDQLLQVEELEIELGFGLIPLVDDKAGGDLLARVTAVRRQLAQELGFLLPPVRIRDNVRLAAQTYAIKMRGEEVARGELLVGRLLAMGPGAEPGAIAGAPAREPVFGLPAVWVQSEQRIEAESAGLTVVEPAAVLATHLTEIARRLAPELLTRQDVQAILDAVKKTHPALVDELVPGLLTLSGVQRVLKRLLQEQVSIRDMITILEALADVTPSVKDLDALVERCREQLGRTLVRPYRDERGRLSVVTLDPRLEEQLAEAVVPGHEGQNRLVLDTAYAQRLADSVSRSVQAAVAVAQHPILLCSQYLRPYLREFVARFIPQIVVLSYPEVTGVASVKTVATVKADGLMGLAA